MNIIRKIAFYDTKPYDKLWFDKLKSNYGMEIKYHESRLTPETARLAEGFDGVVAFVNDVIDSKVIDAFYKSGISIIAMRCAGYNNVDFKAAYNKIRICRVPDYSPYAVAEHTMALLLSVIRKTHRAYYRTRDYNFNISGLTGFDLHGKTVGIIGTGKIGQVLADICTGFGMRVLGFDPYPVDNNKIEYVAFDELCKQADIISLHCPLSESTHHIINRDAIALMKDGVILINTSRGGLIDTEALLDGLRRSEIGGAGLDVYEEESDIFFEDFSNSIIRDDLLTGLITLPNVLVTSHQAFLTDEALEKIARVTLENLHDFFNGKELINEICYQCGKKGNCERKRFGKCF